MSNHFTYEIDERNIRIQLKGHSIEAKEEAWHKFEEQVTPKTNFIQGTNRSYKLNITLNRNVVMPIVFGVIILAFSLLLVNFMSIKNPHRSEVPVNITTTQISPAKTKVQESAVKIESVPQTATKPEIQPQPQPEPEQVKSLTPANSNPKSTPSESVQVIAAGSIPVNENTPTEPTKKKRKKRILESMESEQSPELRPTLVSEDREAEVRPE